MIRAGFIGCEVAATAASFGCETDVIAIDPVPMAVPLGTQVGGAIQRLHEARGPRFHLNRSVREAVTTGQGTTLVLDDDSRIEVDLIVEAAGSNPQCRVA